MQFLLPNHDQSVSILIISCSKNIMMSDQDPGPRLNILKDVFS